MSTRSTIHQKYEQQKALATKYKLLMLFNKLLSFGGEYVMFGDIANTSRRLHIARRIQRVFANSIVTKDDIACGQACCCPMVPKHCHWNVAALYLVGKIPTIASGFVLTQAGAHEYWLAHSWGVAKDGKAIETTEANKKASMYYGIVLSDKEAMTDTMNKAATKPHLLNESLRYALAINLPVVPHK